MKIGVIIPIKKMSNSKQRLSTILRRDQRIELSKCMFEDICEVLINSRYFSEILVVSTENYVQKYTKTTKINYLKENNENGVNSAVELGNKYFINKDFDATIVIPADVPLLNIDILKKLINNILDHEIIISPSVNKNGTNILFRRPPDIIKTSYDENSYHNHLNNVKKKNLKYYIIENESLMLDLDHPQDLKTIYKKLKSSRTKKVIEKFGLEIL
jgi:2-phospho-L-lactate guanylyltransferase|tara:strand:- start:3315 stop:3959 length:645 start_codon:yes stop_codon:yes gene_type:complete